MNVPTLKEWLDASAVRLVENKARHEITVRDGHVVVFSDAHFQPGEVSTAYRGLLQCIKEFRPAAVICNGDAFDGASISKHNRIGWESRCTVKEELEACQVMLGEIERTSKGKLIWTLGNHDSRFETYLAAAAPQYEGIRGIHLKDHFPRWIPAWSCWINGNTVVKHRWKGGFTAGRNNSLNAGLSMVTGHTHQLRIDPVTDYTGTRYGVQTGTLAEPDSACFIDYTEDGPKDWISGFTLLTYKDGRLLRPEAIQKFDEGRVEFRGKVYSV